MLPFFRKIRWRLAANNQFFKYSRYAIGEIVLVVIGILIALYVNNWNEKRKQHHKFDQVLVEVEKELIANIKNCRNVLNNYHVKDSLISRVLFDSLTLNDYRIDTGFYLSIEITEYPNTTLKNDAYLKLLETSEYVTSDRDSILSHMKDLFSDPFLGIENCDKQMYELTNEILSMYKDFQWFGDWVGYKRGTDEMHNFFLNSPLHKGNVILYSKLGLMHHRYQLEVFEIMARKCYEEIHMYLAKSNSKHLDSLLFGYKPEDFEHYVGTYRPYLYSYLDSGRKTRDSTVISIEEGKLYYARYFPDGSNSKREIIPLNDYYFRTEFATGFFHFVIDENGAVQGMNFTSGPTIRKEIKIR